MYHAHSCPRARLPCGRGARVYASMLAAARERRARAARRCGAVVQLRGEAARVAHARLAASPPLGREGAEWVAGGAVPAGRDACGFAGRSGEMQPALAPRVAATRWRAAEGAGVVTIDDDGDDTPGAPPTPAPAPPALHVACAVPLQEGETSEALAQALLRWVLETGGAPLEARVCLLQRECARLPLGVGSCGLSAVVVSKEGLVGDHSEALALLGSWGLFAVPCALGRDLVSRLREAVCTRTDAAEAALAALGRPADAAAEGNHYAELSHRGVGRFDLLLGSKSERLSCSEAVREAAERGPWVGAVAAALGGDAHALLWTAGAVVSRPGAPAGRWHADGGHTKFCFGEDGDRYDLGFRGCNARWLTRWLICHTPMALQCRHPVCRVRVRAARGRARVPSQRLGGGLHRLLARQPPQCRLPAPGLGAGRAAGR